ncbi:hypothetical protein HDU97_003559 [Phlyctochytrium planicorne]|nr:hypothetical protein HDU97_003559 [Phlyctochytrium planicorne]
MAKDRVKEIKEADTSNSSSLEANVGSNEAYPELKLQNGTTPPQYLTSVFRKFNETALAADRLDAIFEIIPAEAEDRFAKESNFFFGRIPVAPTFMSTSFHGLNNVEGSNQSSLAGGGQQGVGSPTLMTPVQTLPRRSSLFRARTVSEKTPTKGTVPFVSISGKEDKGGSAESKGLLGVGDTSRGSASRRGSLRSIVTSSPRRPSFAGSQGGVGIDLARKKTLLRTKTVVGNPVPTPGVVTGHLKNMVQGEGGGDEKGRVGEFKVQIQEPKASTHTVNDPSLFYKDINVEEALTTGDSGIVSSWSQYLTAIWFFWHKHIVCDIYPADSTPESRLALYFERRKLPKFKASLMHLVGLGISSVIRLEGFHFTLMLNVGSGEFSGWNVALKESGFGGLIVSTWISGYLYLRAVGVLNAIPRAIWWFTGVEVVAFASTECENGVRNVPLAYIISWATLFASGVLLSVFNVMSPPGTNVIQDSAWPMVDTLTKIGVPTTLGMVLMVPCLLANGVAMLPPFMSLTSFKSGIPIRGAIFVGLYAFCMACASKYLNVVGSAEVHTEEILLRLTILASVMTYCGIAAVFILFRIRHPDAPRPFRSPLGIFGGISVLVLSIIIVVEQLFVSHVFKLTLLTYALKMAGSGSFYLFNGRMHSLPTEDALIYFFWSKARDTKKSRASSTKASSKASSKSFSKLKQSNVIRMTRSIQDS